jgi:hypothetical protein
LTRDRIAIIVDKEFGERMRGLTTLSYLWVIHSAENRCVVENLWKTLDEATVRDIAVSIGSPEDEDPDLGTEFEYMLDSAFEHFPDVNRIQVFGSPPLLAAFCDAALLERAFKRDDAAESELSYVRS